jgi:hypothetical protein
MRTSIFLLLGFSLWPTAACGPESGDPFTEQPAPPCAQNCAGCCIGEDCRPGDQLTACGNAGTACAVCTGTDSCDLTSNPRTCTLDPSARWRVQPSAATIAQQTTAGFDWDVDGSVPDVVVYGTCPSDGDPIPFRTVEVSSFTPQWTEGGCRTTADALLKNPILINVIDVDFASDDDIAIGSYTLTKSDFGNGGVTLQFPNQVGTLTFRLTRE